MGDTQIVSREQQAGSFLRPQFIPQPTNFDEAWRISTMVLIPLISGHVSGRL